MAVAFLNPLTSPAIEARRAIRRGDVAALEAMLVAMPALATSRIGDAGNSRTLLHDLADSPGHVPQGPASLRLLLAAGADVDAHCVGRHQETPLHYAASNDDVELVDALLDAGADIEAYGSVLGGGAPLFDASAFGQWAAARRLVERGAAPSDFTLAGLGMLDELTHLFAAVPPGPDQLGDLLWGACHGGQRNTAKYLLDLGADINHLPGWDESTPLEAAAQGRHHHLLPWLQSRGALASHAL
jgi:ankyrin repeat protein